MGVDVKYSFDDMGASRIFRDLKRLGELVLVVGLVGARASARHPEATVTVANVGLFNEFGTFRAPERSFIRSAISEGREEIARKYQQQSTLVVAGRRSPVDALQQVGILAARLVRQKLDSAPSWAVPLALSTVKRKGSDIPLRDTDTMRKAIGYAVRDGGTRGPTLVEGYAA